jgi:uncharacterized protein YuzE
MTFDYADHADVLYVTFSETKNKCIYVEIESGVICRIDEASNQIVGLTITDFMRRLRDGIPINIPELHKGLSASNFWQLDAGGK